MSINSDNSDHPHHFDTSASSLARIAAALEKLAFGSVLSQSDSPSSSVPLLLLLPHIFNGGLYLDGGTGKVAAGGNPATPPLNLLLGIDREGDFAGKYAAICGKSTRQQCSVVGRTGHGKIQPLLNPYTSIFAKKI